MQAGLTAVNRGSVPTHVGDVSDSLPVSEEFWAQCGFQRAERSPFASAHFDRPKRLAVGVKHVARQSRILTRCSLGLWQGKPQKPRGPAFKPVCRAASTWGFDWRLCASHPIAFAGGIILHQRAYFGNRSVLDCENETGLTMLYA